MGPSMPMPVQSNSRSGKKAPSTSAGRRHVVQKYSSRITNIYSASVP